VETPPRAWRRSHLTSVGDDGAGRLTREESTSKHSPHISETSLLRAHMT